MSSKIVMICMVCMLLAACAQKTHTTHWIPEVDAAPSYFSELSKWKKTARVYEGLDIRTFVKATYLSDVLRHAYVKEHARVYHLTADQQHRLFQEHVVESQHRSIGR